MSTERTFLTDLTSFGECREQLEPLCRELAADLKKRTERRAIERLFVKLKFADFSRTSVERAGRVPLIAVYESLLEEGFSRGGKPVRLIGVGVRFSERSAEQLELALPSS